LLTGGPLRTEPLPESDLPTTRADPWESGDKAGAGEAQRETMLIIVPPSGRQLTLPAEGEAVIGRLDATRGVFPTSTLPRKAVWKAACRAGMRAFTSRNPSISSRIWAVPTARSERPAPDAVPASSVA